MILHRGVLSILLILLIEEERADAASLANG
jgi:hypothetical protein